MAQAYPITIPNTTFPDFRAKMNESFLALQTMNSGTIAPVTPYIGMLWLDTSTNLIKQWNGTLWITHGRDNGSNWWGITAGDIGALTAGNNLSDLSNRDVARSNLGIASIGNNPILNGDFSSDLVAFTTSNFSISTAPQKIYEMWRWDAGADGGTLATGTATRIVTPGGIIASPFGDTTTYLRISNTSQGVSLGAVSYARIQQLIEDVRTLSGNVCTVSFWARSTVVGKKIGVYLEQNFGTGGSTTQPINGATHTLSSTWQRYTTTVTLPGVSGKTIGTNSYLGLYIYVQSGASIGGGVGSIPWVGNGDLDITNVMIHPGSAVIHFFKEPINVIHAKIRRYYEVIPVYYGALMNGGVSYNIPIYMFPKRTTPSTTINSLTVNNCTFSVSNLNPFAIAGVVTPGGSGAQQHSVSCNVLVDAQF